jgi:hypothetical protein
LRSGIAPEVPALAIKEKADELHFRSFPRERDLARALGEAFDIEFGDKSGQLSYWFAKPQDHTRERFGLYREVLVIYSRHQQTDARVLAAISRITSNPVHRDRSEPVLAIVIHEGSDADAIALDRQADRVLVIFRADELLHSARGSLFVRSRIAQQIGAVDLFGVSSPLQNDAYFFGRQSIVEQLATKTFVKVENSGVFGLRKTGKTSVLNALQRKGDGYSRLVLYQDCENPTLYRVRWWTFLERVASAALERVGLDGITSPYSEDSAGFRFASDLKRAVSRANVAGVALLLDEIEHITPKISGLPAKHWDSDFLYLWQTLRAVQQDSPTLVSFVVAGVNPACVNETHFNDVPNPLFQFATPMYLEPLAVKDIRSMVRTLGRYTGLDFEEPVYNYLGSRFGGHAYLIRLACSEVWRNSDTTSPTELTSIGTGKFEVLRQEIRSRLAQPIKDILLSLVWWYPDEYDLLRVLAEGDADFVRSYLEDEAASMLQFARYGLIDHQHGTFLIRELRNFLAEAGAEYKKEISPFRRSELPPELLPEVPDLVKLGQLFDLKARLEIRIRRAIVVYLGIRAGWDDQRLARLMLKGIPAIPKSRPDPSQIFVGRKPQDAIQQLFLSDLGLIIIANWGDFDSLFDSQRDKFTRALEQVNVARRHDSHTKPVTETDFRAFEASYRWLLDHLSRLPPEFAGGLPE